MRESLSRMGMLVAIVVMLFPILGAGIQGNEIRRQAMFKAMRAEHLRCLADQATRSAERLALKRQLQLEHDHAHLSGSRLQGAAGRTL